MEKARSFLVGASWVTSQSAAWAVEVTALKPETMATLVQMARDIYPHDRIPDQFYVVAVKGYDTSATTLACYSGAGFDPALREDGDVLLIGADRLYA